MTARAAILRDGTDVFSIEPIKIGELRADELLVRMVGAGVCHTDELFRNGTYPFARPCVLGHEGAGVVEAVGEKVDRIQPGDHVVLSVMYCGHCNHCLDGQHYLCENIYEANFGGRPGGGSAYSQCGHPIQSHFDGQSSFSTHAVTTTKNTIKIRKDAPLHLMGPFGCGFRTGLGAIMNSFHPKPGDSIVVFGAGSVGLSAIIGAKLMACHPIVAVDLNEDRRELAKELGATYAFSGDLKTIAESVRDVTKGGATFALDTTGNPHVVRAALESTGVGGCLGVLAGSPLGTELTFDANHLLFGGRKVQGINMGDGNGHTFIPRLIDLYMEGLLPVGRLITEYAFDEINQAFDDTKNGDCIKAVLRF